MDGVDIHELDFFEDERGWLLKIIKQEYMDEGSLGEIYVTTSKPGIVRANHYHKHTTEWFCVVRGKAKLVLQDIESQERKEIMMGDGRLVTVKIPAGIAHAVKNIGDEDMYLIAVADKPYDPQAPDTYTYDMEI